MGTFEKVPESHFFHSMTAEIYHWRCISKRTEKCVQRQTQLKNQVMR